MRSPQKLLEDLEQGSISMKDQKFNLEFCDVYKYPDEIKEHFIFILNQICDNFGWENILSIILYGSTARGELSYTIKNGKLDIFSDYELEVIYKNKIPRHRMDNLKKNLQKLSSQIKNPLFHVDITYNTKWSFWLKARLDRRIAIYETKKNGIILYGENFLKKLPEITLKNLDMGNTNELTLIRLWMQLLFIPKNVIIGNPSKYEVEILKYFLARNSLEILTIFLPNQGILLPTYKDRVRYFSQKYKKFSYVFPEDFHVFLNECYNVKKTLHYNLSLKDYYQNMLEGYLCLLEYLLGAEKVSSDLFERAEKVSEILYSGKKDFLKDNSLSKYRRIRREFRMWKNRPFGKLPLIWLFRDKRPYILGFLLNMHMFLFNELFEKKEKVNFLENANRFMAKFSNINLKIQNDIQGWSKLRERFIKFMSYWLYNDPFYVYSIRREMF